jgi:hypothetical protein
VVDEPELDLGNIPSTELKKFEITITNQGPSTQVIQNIQAQCGCTTVAPIQHFIHPGESLALPVTFNPHGYWGPVTKGIEIHTSDPARASFTWQFRMTVQSAVIPQPKAVYLEASEGSTKPSSADFRFVAVAAAIKPKSVTLEGGEGPLPAVEWHQEMGEVRGHITLDPTRYSASQKASMRAQTHQGRLVLRMEDGTMDWAEVVWLLKPVFSAPQSFTFFATQGQVLQRNSIISSQTPFKITEAKVSSPDFTVDISPSTTPSLYAVRVNIQANATLKPGSHSERLILKTDNPQVPELIIPVTAMVNPMQ